MSFWGWFFNPLIRNRIWIRTKADMDPPNIYISRVTALLKMFRFQVPTIYSRGGGRAAWGVCPACLRPCLAPASCPAASVPPPHRRTQVGSPPPSASSLTASGASSALRTSSSRTKLYRIWKLILSQITQTLISTGTPVPEVTFSGSEFAVKVVFMVFPI